MEMKAIFGDSWQDPDRMRALYSEFRNRNLNPEGWTTKMSDWIAFLNKLCKNQKFITFALHDLKNALEFDGNQPECLPTVLTDMQSKGLIVPMTDFQSRLKNQSWASWGFDWLVKKPVSWGFSIIQQSIFGPVVTTTEYVHLEVLKEAASTVLNRFEGKVLSENIKTMLDVKVFYNSCNDLTINFRTFFLVLSYLESKGQIVILKEGENYYLKIKHRDEKPVLTETDIGILKLQKAQGTIEAEMEKLEQEMEMCREEAKIALRNKNKLKAKSLLAKKQRIEKQINEKSKAASNVESMLLQLESSFTNKDVLNALKAGTCAQKKINADGASVKNAEDTMDQIEDAFDEQNEIADILGRGLNTGYQISDDELEAELEELLELDKLNINSETTKREEELDLRLPDVPTDDLPIKTIVSEPIRLNN